MEGSTATQFDGIVAPNGELEMSPVPEELVEVGRQYRLLIVGRPQDNLQTYRSASLIITQLLQH
jgi:hypothetical protein